MWQSTMGSSIHETHCFVGPLFSVWMFKSRPSPKRRYKTFPNFLNAIMPQRTFIFFRKLFSCTLKMLVNVKLYLLFLTSTSQFNYQSNHSLLLHPKIDAIKPSSLHSMWILIACYFHSLTIVTNNYVVLLLVIDASSAA